MNQNQKQKDNKSTKIIHNYINKRLENNNKNNNNPFNNYKFYEIKYLKTTKNKEKQIFNFAKLNNTNNTNDTNIKLNNSNNKNIIPNDKSINYTNIKQKINEYNKRIENKKNQKEEILNNIKNSNNIYTNIMKKNERFLKHKIKLNNILGKINKKSNKKRKKAKSKNQLDVEKNLDKLKSKSFREYSNIDELSCSYVNNSLTIHGSISHKKYKEDDDNDLIKEEGYSRVKNELFNNYNNNKSKKDYKNKIGYSYNILKCQFGCRFSIRKTNKRQL